MVDEETPDRFTTTITAPTDDDPLQALADLATSRRRLEAEIEICVRRARVKGASWEAIAAALGVSRQAVHKKYAKGRLG